MKPSRFRTRFPSLIVFAAFASFPFLNGPTAAVAKDVNGSYWLPPSPIPEILDAPPPPAVFVSPGREWIALLERSNLPPIEELAQPELPLAGYRINPATNGPSRVSYYRGISFLRIDTGERREVALPGVARIDDPQWSPDGTKLAFTNTVETGIELWVVEAGSGRIRRLTAPDVNGLRGTVFTWSPDSQSLLTRRIPRDRGDPPTRPNVPAGPVIQENFGPAAPVRTYQNLLSNPHDEDLFDYYFTSQLIRVNVEDGSAAALGEPGLISYYSVSPNGEYILIDRTKRPYSYLAPAYTFAGETYVADRDGNRVHQVEDRQTVVFPRIGRDMVNPGPRYVHWRDDAPATLVWAEAMDGGDARAEAAVRDRVWMLEAPFTGDPAILIDLDQRYANIRWGRDDLALVETIWRTNSRTKTYRVNPANPREEPILLWDRSSEDRYDDPGTPITRPTETGTRTLLFSASGGSIFLSGAGGSPKGDFPFLDRLHLDTREVDRLWQSDSEHYEYTVAVLDTEGPVLLTRRESATEPPNYFVRDLAGGDVRPLTDFPDPAPQLAEIQQEIITYPRADGIQLSARLFTPPGYDRERDGPLPAVLWAYPREFRDADAASQLTGSPNRFSRPAGSSPLFLLTQGYAVIEGATMPIIGVGDEEPNDTYIEQLVASAQAAVDKVVEMGVVDRERVAVGGHSYGAFMAANLLAHSDLFRAGIARSGAYNRTLTPFGFQAERRSYWQAQEIYLRMSPFNYAHQITEPLLLIHGIEDNNSGTFPIQSERLYQALKGHGTVARLVMLPHESHGYAARESVLHVLAETIAWLDLHLNASRSGN